MDTWRIFVGMHKSQLLASREGLDLDNLRQSARRIPGLTARGSVLNGSCRLPSCRTIGRARKGAKGVPAKGLHKGAKGVPAKRLIGGRTECFHVEGNYLNFISSRVLVIL